jgi:hypothetical protein
MAQTEKVVRMRRAESRMMDTGYGAAKEDSAMYELDVELFKVFPAGGWNIVHVPNERGEELRIHLESHGIRSKVSPPAGTSYERVEIEGDIDPEDLQAIIDCWER